MRALLHKYWGYDSFRPLQQEAISAVLAGRDSVVVLPTGGGKSLCFQAPAVKMPGLAVVVSPLISLMKDQVDALTECGVPAACVNSSLTTTEKARVAHQIRTGQLKLLYIAPERLCMEQTRQFLRDANVSFFAIDEAHCISSWGHDFRPEYRGLGMLKDEFPGIAVHAYTATATEAVRTDIARQLKLDDPQFHVGNFDRPNLVYRVQPRVDQLRQIRDVLERHRGEAGIIYCIRRTDCEEVSEALNRAGYKTRPYHAGLTDEQRIVNQDAFLKDEVETIVATVAFGMGIDKSNVRYVI
ncbi:MAG: ATP-dependent helicase RecQ, partial [Planctomycetaceae bacterium]|nr:ATP-dependent helicase RecQ [Planctomycetaceae bacterium]